MPDDPTPDVTAWYADRLAAHEDRERALWDAYLRVTKGCPGDLEGYLQAEPLAWRRLRRGLAELAHDRRRDAFERDRAAAEASGRRLAG